MNSEAKSINIEQYTQINSNYYNQQYEYINKYNKKITLNWAALFLGPTWFIYRKMYLVGILMYVISLVSIGAYMVTDLLVSIFVVTVSLLGNYIYLKKVEKEIKNKSADEVIKSGGTNLILAGVLLFIYYTLMSSKILIYIAYDKMGLF